MRRDLEEDLYSNFPILFEHRYLPPNETCMHASIEIGSGWYGILRQLCLEINGIVTHQGLNPNDYQFVQIKEKFGTLRIYMTNSGHEQMWPKLQRAMSASCDICEGCGGLSKGEDAGFNRRCDACVRERERQRRESPERLKKEWMKWQEREDRRAEENKSTASMAEKQKKTKCLLM